MPWTTTDDAEEFLSAAGPFLRRRPVEHTVALTVAETVRDRGPNAYGPQPPLFGWWRHDGLVAGAFLRTPPHPVLLAAAPPEAVAGLVAALLADGRPVPGVNGVDAQARAFADAWSAASGAPVRVGRLSRLYRLGDLVEPDPAPPGAARVAGDADRPLLEDWFAAFGRDIGEEPVDVAGEVDRRMGRLRLWEVDGEAGSREAVSMAGSTRPSSGMVRVDAVYTPPRWRRHGYAAAVTAAVTGAALDAGASDVVLFTDLANPTSNSVYTRLGYRPVEDRALLLFG